MNTSIVYDAANRVVTITDQTGGGTALATYVYSYDNADRVTTEANAEGTVTYSYDSGGELLSASGSRTESYSYDSGGNRTMTGYTTGTGNELSASPGYTYTYDNEGNLTGQTNTSTHVVTTYTYDNRNRLTEVTTGGTVVATYTYDALDRRIGIDDNGTQTWTVYDGNNPYADFNGSGTLKQRYIFGPGVVNGAVVDQILARTSSGGSTAWYLPDKLGSVRDIVDSSGNELDHVVFDSFGNVVTDANAANGDRFKYAGMEYDSATGQYYDRARYYDAAIGRFMSQDPMGFAAGDANLYRYVGNQPSDMVDPSGLQPLPPGRLGPPLSDKELAYYKAMQEMIKNGLKELENEESAHNAEYSGLLKRFELTVASQNAIAALFDLQKNALDKEDSTPTGSHGITRRKVRNDPSKGYITYFEKDMLDQRKFRAILETMLHEMYHYTGWSHADHPGGPDSPNNTPARYAEAMARLLATTQVYKQLQTNYPIGK